MKQTTLLFFSFCTLLISIAANAQSGTITTIAGNGTMGFYGDGGPATASILSEPGYLSWGYYGGYGTLYLNDASNNRIRQIKIGSIIRSVAGNGTTTYTGDGTMATANGISRAGGVCVDRHGNAYFADQYNYAIRKISYSGIVTTYAGIGTAGCSGDNGPATGASLMLPYAVASDTAGNIYFADQTCHKIRRVGTDGIITTIAGTGTPGYNSDGIAATDAQLNYPTYVRIDTLGQIFITDNGNQRIRKINPAGIISTIAGTGILGFSGDSGPATAAQLRYPSGIGFDSYGNIYIADSYNNRIRMVDHATGFIYTVAGNGTPGYMGDNGPATNAELQNPTDVVIDNHNDIYIADWHNNAIRRVEALYIPTSFSLPIAETAEFVLSPNPASGMLHFSWSNFAPGEHSLQVFDMLGRLVKQFSLSAGSVSGAATFDISKIPSGTYVAAITNNGARIRQTIVVSNPY